MSQCHKKAASMKLIIATAEAFCSTNQKKDKEEGKKIEA